MANCGIEYIGLPGAVELVRTGRIDGLVGTVGALVLLAAVVVVGGASEMIGLKILATVVEYATS